MVVTLLTCHNASIAKLDGRASLQEVSSMANQQLLDFLKQGVYDWNQWRRDHLGIRPDLSGADLSGVNLSGAAQSGVDLSRANLNTANLVLCHTSSEG
jgi:uncharacterized protein YjbI with pentapeptide repeats